MKLSWRALTRPLPMPFAAGPASCPRGSGRTLAQQMILRLAAVGLVFIVAGSAALAIAAETYGSALIASRSEEEILLTQTVLRKAEEGLVASARQMATSRAIGQALLEGRVGGLAAQARSIQAAYELGAVAVIDADGDLLVELGGPPPATIRRLAASTHAQLDSTCIEFLDGHPWMFAGSLYRSADDPARWAVTVVGKRIDQDEVFESMEEEGVEVAFHTRAVPAAPGRTTFAYATRDGAEVFVSIDVSNERYYAELSRTLAAIAVGGALGFLILIFLAARAVATATRPLDVLARTATAVASGEGAGLVPVRGPRDVASTASAFNRMVTAVAEREARLRNLYDEARASADELEHRAYHDALTGLANRVWLRERLDAALGDPSGGADLALLLLDLDQFKAVNDSFGHHVGDELLVMVAKRLLGAVPADALVSRLGGDEFAVLLPGAGRAAAVARAASIVAALGMPFSLGVQELRIGATVGIALHPEHGRDASTLLRRADMAMYDAKSSGEGHAVYAGHEDDERAIRRLMIASEIRGAVERGELSVLYQPEIDLRSGRIVRAEALVRWTHPQLGEVSPSEFIPVAEASGAIRPLTEFVLRTALGDARRWRAVDPQVGVAVNLSARTLRDADLPDLIERMLIETGCTPCTLLLEITESLVMSDPKRSAEAIAAVRDRGVCWALDDFGTGHSSLALLQRLPLDEIKIDRSFVSGSGRDDRSAAIVRATVQIARAFGLRVVGEGVEDEATAAWLRELGCDMAQGYLFGRPMPAAGMLAALTQAAPARTARPDAAAVAVAVIPANITAPDVAFAAA